jgi:putative transcriptional regulator
MNRVTRLLGAVAGLLALWGGFSAAAQAADLSRAVILVASDQLRDSPFAETVVLATPLPEGGHMGFVLNRPTGAKLESLLPSQASTRNVVDPVYAGGPALTDYLFAVTRKPPADQGTFVVLLPGLFVAMDGVAVDSMIEKAPNEARYFVGLMVWSRDELENDVQSGAWHVRPANADAVLPANASDLWKSLTGTEV